MFDIIYQLFLDTISQMGWYIPVYIVVGFVGQLLKEVR